MDISLCIINVWEMPQAAWEFRNCNALIFPPLYFNEFFIEKLFHLGTVFFHAYIKKSSHLTWNCDILQTYTLHSCFLFCQWPCLIIHYLHHHSPAPTNTTTLTDCDSHLALNSCYCSVHSHQQVALHLPFSWGKTLCNPFSQHFSMRVHNVKTF